MSDTTPAPALAAVVYGPGGGADALLAAFAEELRAAGHRLGGVVQRNSSGADCADMALEDLADGRLIGISQRLGRDSRGCRLDPAGLAEAAVAVRSAIAARVELVFVNKFGARESQGQGLAAEIGAAIVEGVPVLTAVSTSLLDPWHDFTGGIGVLLEPDPEALRAWWAGVGTGHSGP